MMDRWMDEWIVRLTKEGIHRILERKREKNSAKRGDRWADLGAVEMTVMDVQVSGRGCKERWS